MIKRIINSILNIGFWPSIQKLLQKIIGISDIRAQEKMEVEQIKDELNTLHYFLNTFHTISDISVATDHDLRIMQCCDAEFLRIVTNECDKLGLQYWLDFGTLLGAVRHKGFIPWDDDIDLAMPRADYNKALTALKDVLIAKGCSFEETNRIGIGYKHEQTGIWIDIFAVDEYNSDKPIDEVREELNVSIFKYNNLYEKYKGIPSVSWRKNKRDILIGGHSGTSRVFYHQPEFFRKAIIRSVDVVYPLSQIKFEGYTFNAPCNIDLYLKEYYGDTYMSFPRRGVLHHNLGRGPLSTWAKRHGVDMNDILNELKLM